MAIGNYDLALINAQIAEASDDAYDAILSAGKQQAQIAQIREEMLIRERRDHFIDVWFRNILIALGLLATAL